MSDIRVLEEKNGKSECSCVQWSSTVSCCEFFRKKLPKNLEKKDPLPGWLTKIIFHSKILQKKVSLLKINSYCDDIFSELFISDNYFHHKFQTFFIIDRNILFNYCTTSIEINFICDFTDRLFSMIWFDWHDMIWYDMIWKRNRSVSIKFFIYHIGCFRYATLGNWLCWQFQ